METLILYVASTMNDNSSTACHIDWMRTPTDAVHIVGFTLNQSIPYMCRIKILLFFVYVFSYIQQADPQ